MVTQQINLNSLDEGGDNLTPIYARNEMEPDQYTIAPDDALGAVDENAIAVVPILGVIHAGAYGPAEAKEPTPLFAH